MDEDTEELRLGVFRVHTLSERVQRLRQRLELLGGHWDAVRMRGVASSHTVLDELEAEVARLEEGLPPYVACPPCLDVHPEGYHTLVT